MSARRRWVRYDGPLVRLSRDGQWAVCARVDCGTRFARRVEESSPLKEGLWARDLPFAMLRFLPGWVNKEAHHLDDGWMVPGGVWRMSKRFRRRPPRQGWRKAGYGYPALVICPACHQAQVADEEVLGLR